MKIKLFIAALAIAVVGFSACGGDDKKSSDKEITGFSVNGVPYEINQSNGTIYHKYSKQSENNWPGMPAGKIAPEIVFTGKSISPDPKDQQNFVDNTIEYKVTAEDGTEKKYTVTTEKQPTLP